MSKFLREAKIGLGLNKNLIPAGMYKYIKDFSILRAEENIEFSFDSGSSEIGIAVFYGNCELYIADKKYELGSRNSVFGTKPPHGFFGAKFPCGFYIPRDTNFSINSRTKLELVVCKGWCEEKTEPKLILPQDIKIMHPGKNNWKREVRIIIGADSPSVNMIIGETLSPAGNWSGTPAHKHDVLNPPHESLHEELYLFKMKTDTDFGIQRSYSPEHKINELMFLKNNSLTFMPWGYHQIVAGPGYPLYYLFFLSGKGKKLIPFVDPKHKWLLGLGG